MDAACTIQDSIHVFSLVRKYVSRILGTYQSVPALMGFFFTGNEEKGSGKMIKYYCSEQNRITEIE